MPRFQFRFSSLLKHRRRIEQDRRRQLAGHLRTQMILRNQLRTMQQSITASKQEAADLLVGKVDVDAISRMGAYASHTQLSGQRIVMKLASLERDIHQARANLLDATRQRKALELLRQKHFEAWKTEQQRKETRELDDLANSAFVRRMIGGTV